MAALSVSERVVDRLGSLRGACALARRTGSQNESYLAGFVPIVGPFFVAADETIDRDGRIAFASFGLAQNVGLALVIAGALTQHEVWTLQVNPAARV